MTTEHYYPTLLSTTVLRAVTILQQNMIKTDIDLSENHGFGQRNNHDTAPSSPKLQS